jgi:hypothetical protein
LDVTDRVEPELGREAASDDVHDEFRGLLGRVQAGVLGRVAGEPVEVAEAGELGGVPELMRWALTTMPDLWA